MSLHFKLKFSVVVGRMNTTTLNHLALGLGITACKSFLWQLKFEHHQHVTWMVFGFLCILFHHILFDCHALNLTFLT